MDQEEFQFWCRELIVNPLHTENRVTKLQRKKADGVVNPFVCKDTFPPKRNTPSNRVMYGGYTGAGEHVLRFCAICTDKPILRYVLWQDSYIDVETNKLVREVHTKGFCKVHMSAAWIEQAKHPPDFGWDDLSR